MNVGLCWDNVVNYNSDFIFMRFVWVVIDMFLLNLSKCVQWWILKHKKHKSRKAAQVLQDEVVVTVSASLTSDNESFVRKLLTKIATNFGCKSSIVSNVIDYFR